jgi:hypothetical protein
MIANSKGECFLRDVDDTECRRTLDRASIAAQPKEFATLVTVYFGSLKHKKHKDKDGRPLASRLNVYKTYVTAINNLFSDNDEVKPPA